MNTRTRNIILIVVIIVVAAAVALYYPTQVSKQSIATVTYYCNAGKTITAEYIKGESKPAAGPDLPPSPGGNVSLSLSDGRTMTLAQTISADGARYASLDESFVFWNKGNGALVLENNHQNSYIGCIEAAPEPAGGKLPQVYVNIGDSFSIRLPINYAVDEKYQYEEFGPGKGIAGIRFTIPAAAATGTNLSPDTYLSVEEIPQTQVCSAGLFLAGAVARTVAERDTMYSVASSTGAAAGNRYEETVYALPGTNPCIAVRYFVHYGVFENYPAGAVRRFDKAALLAQLDAIRRTLVIVQ